MLTSDYSFEAQEAAMVTKEKHSFFHLLVLGMESMDSGMPLLSYTPHLESQHLSVTCFCVLEALYLTKTISSQSRR